jgi:outer membrane protein assembly factor BamB
MSILRIAVFVGLLACIARAADHWTQFRGPNAQGHSEAKGLPVNPADPANIRWRTEIHGRAWSSPVVWGKQVWLTTATEDGRQLYAVCVDADSGNIIHDLKLFDIAQPQFAHPFNTYASPTPVIEEGRVYVTFGSPGTACLDTATGKVLWSRTDFVCNHYRGAGSSPVLFEGLLLMHFDGSDHQFVVALDKTTGKTVWQSRRSVDFKDLNEQGQPKLEGDLRKAFSTPVIATVNGQPQLVSLASYALYGYDVRSGKELWRMEQWECFSGSNIPIIGQGFIYSPLGHSRGQLWAIPLGEQGVIDPARIRWKVRQNVPTRSSPILVDGLLYMVDDGGMATCIDAENGREVWRQKIKSSYSASPIHADGRIYFFAESGHITTIEPGRAYKQLAEGKIEEGFMATPAIAGKAMFLRSKKALYRSETR